jgi:hypothetical protein
MTPPPPPIIIRSPHYFVRLTHRLRNRVPMWVVYRPITVEYPGLWVARMHVTLPEPRPTRFVMTHDTLGQLRQMLPCFTARLARNPDDVPEIEEVWL